MAGSRKVFKPIGSSNHKLKEIGCDIEAWYEEGGRLCRPYGL